MRWIDVFAVIAFAAPIQMAEIVKGEGQYTIVAPGTIHSNREYNVAVAVHHIKEPVKLKIGITGPSHNISQTVELAKSEEFKQLTFKLPPLKKGNYNLTAEGVSGLKFKNTTKLNWSSFHPYVYIQTDKRKYEPGDIVNFRVIFLDENLRPDVAQDDVVISFEDSKRYRIKELKHIKTNSGVYTDKFELSKLATLGSWNLLVQHGNSDAKKRVYFDVEKYVLPKYSVNVENTREVSVRDGDMQVVVRANYTYGKPVNGKVLLNIELKDDSDWNYQDGESGPWYPSHTMLSTADMVNGKAKFDLNVKEFADYLPYKTSPRYAEITATVEEDFTGVKINGTSDTKLYPYRYKMSCFYDSEIKFHHDKEQEFNFVIKYVDGTLLKDTKPVVRAIFTEGIRYADTIYDGKKKPDLPEIEKKTFKYESHVNATGIVSFKLKLPDLPDLDESFTRYYITELEFVDEKRQLCSTKPYREPKKIDPPVVEKEKATEWFKVDLQLPEDISSAKAGTEYNITVNSSRRLVYFIYNIVGRGNVLHTERVELPKPQKIYNISLTPTFMMSPYGRIYIYYVDDTGEFHYAEETFHVDVELQNKIEISGPTEVKPGADVALEIKTAPKSFVGLLAVDQSVLMLGINNDINIDSLDRRMRRYDTRTPWQGGYSYYPGKITGVVTLTNANFFYNRTVPWEDEENARESVEDASVESGEDDNDNITMEDSEGVSAENGKVGGGVGGGGKTDTGGPADEFYHVRKNFVETWIFADINSTESEYFEWVKTIPDTITSWVVSAFAIHPEKGLAVTDDKTNIKTFQPFFVSVRLPYSVKRGEVINVPALVFNYLPYRADVEVTLYNLDDEYEFVDPSNEVIGEQERTQKLEVPANEAAGVSFLLRPKIIGNILLKFDAISLTAGDTLHKSLKVVPEGVTQYNNHAIFINLKDVHDFKDTFELELPEEYVKDSQHVEFAVVGNLLGPVFGNLEQLLRLPSGCGEQTMSKMVPNYLVRNYLKSIKKLTPALESRIKHNLEQGYQNMLHYRHEDGSFSSFGPGKWREEDPPRNGSTWLTAYVLRWLTQISAAELVQIDKKLLEKGYEFLLSKQATNGTFTETGEYFYDSQRSLLTQTGHALLALLEQKQPKQKAINKAVAYLSAHLEEKTELLPKAIATYALQRAKATDAPKHVASLKVLAKHADDVEITSYAVLTLLEMEQPDSQLNAIRWLVEQRNNYGGFASSQDTVIGLQALIKFAEKSGYEAALWDVTVSNHGQREKTETLKLTEDNGLVLQRVEFPQGTKSLEFTVKGKGAALVQISYQYNIVEKEPKPSFQIRTYIPFSVLSAKLELAVYVRYVGKSEASNMAILEVSLPSGYTADEASFKDILSVERVRLVETKNEESVVVIYFESLPKNEAKWIRIVAYKTFAVANQKPAPVVLYDYYDTNKKATEYYQIESKAL